MEVAAAGVLIYGYNGEDALQIKLFLDAAFAFPVFLTSASGRNEERLLDILQSATSNSFVDEKTKIMMLLGFSEEQVRMILGSFPSGAEALPRPIFCMLTEENRNWPLAELLEHLERERRYWAEKKGDA